MKNAEAEESLKKPGFKYMTNMETLVGPNLLQLKICVRDKQKERTPKESFLVFSEITKRFGLLFAGNRIVVPEELKIQVVDELQFGHPGSTKMLAEICIIWW